MAKYLDSTGFNHFLGKLNTLLNTKAGVSHTHKYAGSSSAGGAANSVANSIAVKLNSGTSEGTNLFTFNGSASKTINITPSAIGASASNHTHPYAGSSSAGGAANSVANNLTIQFNGTTNATFNGSTAKTINITPSAIGAASSSGTYTKAEIDNMLGSISGGGSGPASSLTNSLTIKLNSGTSEGTNLFTFNGASAKTVNITASAIGASASNHTHPYAGSSSAGGAANSVKTNLVVKLNGGSTEDTNLFTFNGSTAKTINITPSAIGAAAASHTHKYAGSSSDGGAATNANNVYETLTNPSSYTSYYIPFNTNASSGNKSLLCNDGLQYYTKEGTTSAVGDAELGVGNNIASGTAGNKRGRIYMYGTSSGFTTIEPGYNGTANVTITLPSSDGTLSLNGHTHNYAGSSSAGGAATNVYGTLTNPYNGTTYYIPFNSSYATGDKSLLLNDGLQYYTLEGKTSANGEAQLGLGNDIASGTAGNKRGKIYMYGTSSGYTSIVPGNNSTDSITITLPSSTGTLSLDGHTHSSCNKGAFGTGAIRNISSGTSLPSSGNEDDIFILLS